MNKIFAKEYWTNKKLGWVDVSDPRFQTGELVKDDKFGPFVPAIDAKTGVSIGRVDKNHPRILSGEWINTKKGKRCISPKGDKHNKLTLWVKAKTDIGENWVPSNLNKY